MKCDCCGRRKKLLESFANIEIENGSLNLCVECNDLAYKVRDAADEHNKEEFKKYLKQWEKRENSPCDKYLNWKNEFISKQMGIIEGK